MYMHLMYLVTSIGCSLHIVHDLISPLGMAIYLSLLICNNSHQCIYANIRITILEVCQKKILSGTYLLVLCL